MCFTHLPSAVLLHPEDAVVVRHGGDQVGTAIAIHVEDVDESGLAEVEVLVEFPVARAGIGRRFDTSLSG